jgi:D-arabinose 1-dehydrogenase-like Zn-dependent alcohol dehydrogenase
MCAGTTMYAPLKEAGAGAATRLGIVGLGGLGMMGIKLGKALGCTVIAISRGEAKRSLAMRAGADSYLASSDAEQMAANTGHLDLILNTIPTNHNPSIFTSLLSPEGSHVLVGLHASSIASGSVNFLLPGRTRERMTFIGGLASTQEVMDLCARDNIKTEIDIQPVTELNRIFEALDGSNESGKRFVLDIAGSLGRDVNTAPATQLAPHAAPDQTLRDVADTLVSKLLAENDA